MDANLAIAFPEPTPQDVGDLGPPALLRGTARGLEMHVNARAELGAVVAALEKRLDEAPGFFRGSDVRVCVEDGPLPAGALARLDELAQRFGLRIVEVKAGAVPRPNLATGSAPTGFEDEAPTHIAITPLPLAADLEPSVDPVTLADLELTELVKLLPDSFDEPTQTAVPLTLAASPEAELETSEGTRLVVGPVRSGVILDHAGHLIVFGDVNPGAEVRAKGNIVVLGRLRGTAHAAIGQDVGFILALRLEPQQLRISRSVARAGDSDGPVTDAEIAYITGGGIVVERFTGKLPRNLATSI